MSDAAERFRALHAGPAAFVMPNAWDGASAVLMKQAGFPALGTSSAAIAWALGRPDGARAVSRVEAIDNGVLMRRLTGLPVNGDLEDGFGPSPQDCAATVIAAADAGLAGLGIEDTTADPAHPIHDYDEAVVRVRRAVEAAKGRIVLTGRTDLLLFGRADLDEVIRRLVAFAEEGADVLYAPGLQDMDSIRAVVRAVAPKPVNVLIGPRGATATVAELSAAGVKRISLGAALYRLAMAAVADAGQRLAQGDLSVMAGALPSSEIEPLLT
jgi:2-methylisocitrate lyase-like PEP mutase family enzyme